MSHLVVVLPSVPVDGERMQLADKTLSGLAAFAERWPGPVTAVGPGVDADQGGNLGLGWYDRSDLDVPVLAGDPRELILQLAPDVLQVSLSARERELVDLGVPSVVFAENPSVERLRHAWGDAEPWAKPRMVGGAIKQEGRQMAMLRRGQALACNGWNAWRWYAPTARRFHSHKPLLVFDSRLPIDRVWTADERLGSQSQHRERLHLAFSGRFHVAKGVRYAVEASNELERRGVAHTLSLLGGGPLEPQLRSIAGQHVQFLGELDFDPTWMDFVAQHVDLMLLPHVQGDPSGTYLETAGLGVPIVGFDNAAVRGFVRHGQFGWLAERRDATALADVIERLAKDPGEVRRAAQRGVEFARRNAFEEAFDARVEQLMRVAGV